MIETIEKDLRQEPWIALPPREGSLAIPIIALQNSDRIIATVWPEDGKPSEREGNLVAASSVLLLACEAVLACPTLHDENGHAYLKVDARSLNGTATFVAEAVHKAKNTRP